MARKNEWTKTERELMEKNNLLQFQLDNAQREIQILKADLQYIKHQLVEEDSRAEAFEFVLRMLFKYPVVSAPPEKK